MRDLTNEPTFGRSHLAGPVSTLCGGGGGVDLDLENEFIGTGPVETFKN